MEIPDFISSLEEYDAGYSPQTIYCLIDKLSGARLFLKDNGNVHNPPQGTLVDTAIVESQGDRLFDFFLVPHNATVATANPVHFKVAYNTSEFGKKDIETFTN